MDSKIVLCALLLFGPAICSAKKKGKYGAWSYNPSSPDGPTNWGRIQGGANCLGAQQSPVDINSLETEEIEYTPLRFRGYDSNGRAGDARPVRMVNNGKAFKVELEGDYLIRGGGLPSLYKAAQLHVHWGGADMIKGSEHTVNGQAFPAEVHIVHYDARLYQSLGAAVTQPQGLAVLGFFVRLGRHNQAWDNIISHMDVIKYAKQSFDFTQQPFRLDSLLPNNLQNFYRYSGSLTTPGCYESVVWTVFDTPIELSRVQLDKFRILTKLPKPPAAQTRDRFFGGRRAEKEEDLIVNNYRPVQRLNERIVYQSFEHEEPDYDSQEFRSPVYAGVGYRGIGNTAGGIGNTAGGTGGFNNNYHSESNEPTSRQSYPPGGGFNTYAGQDTAFAGGVGEATGTTGDFESYFGIFDSTPENNGNEHVTAEQGSANAQGGGPGGNDGLADPWGGVDGTGGVYGGGGDGDAYGDAVDYYYGGGNADANGAGGAYGAGDPYGGGGYPTGANGDLYGGNSNPTSVGKNSFGGEDPYGGDPYGGGEGPHGAGGDPYGGGGDPYGTGGDPYGTGGDPYGTGGDPYGTGGDPFGGIGDPASAGKDPHVSIPETGIINSVNKGTGAATGDSGPQLADETKTTLTDTYNYGGAKDGYGLTNTAEEDPYRTGYAGHNQLARLWQQLVNREYTDQQDAAYYDTAIGVNELTENVPIDHQYYENALYDPYENYKY